MAAVCAPQQVDEVTLPRIERCPNCWEAVLLAAFGGGLAVLEPAEIVERMPCPTCKAETNRDRDVECWRCGDAGFIGERLAELPQVFGVSRLGHVRRLDACSQWEGEALHYPHVCP